MKYHLTFDRLGNQVARPNHTPRGHRLLQSICLAICLVLLVVLAGARP
jgi:hypothetical protein